MHNTTSLLLFLTIASFPLYLLPSGGVQLSHGFFSLFFLSFFAEFNRSRKQPLNKNIKRIFSSLVFLVVYIVVIQLVYGAAYESLGMVKFALFYIFNCIYVLAIYHYLKIYGQTGINVIFVAIFVAILLTFGGLMAGVSSSTSRGTSFFNNPNQLGYFALISMVLMLVFHTIGTVKHVKTLSLAAIAICLLLTAASLSKAAMIAAVFALLCFAPSFKRSELVLLGLLILATSPLWIERFTDSSQYERVVDRIQNIGKQDDDNFAARGYGRISRYPEYIVTGAGEGGLWRFRASYEIHSTFGNLLFSYGLIGFGIFVFFNYQCFRFSGYLYCILFGAVFAYGLTHNGIRFSYLWLLYAIFLTLAEAQSHSTQRLAFLPRQLAPHSPDLGRQRYPQNR